VEAFFQQFTDTEHWPPGGRKQYSMAGGRKQYSMIAGKTFHPQSSSFRKKVSTAEMCGMHQTRMEKRHKGLLSTV
jgi:hypothetical protein